MLRAIGVQHVRHDSAVIVAGGNDDPVGPQKVGPLVRPGIEQRGRDQPRTCIGHRGFIGRLTAGSGVVRIIGDVDDVGACARCA